MKVAIATPRPTRIPAARTVRPNALLGSQNADRGPVADGRRPDTRRGAVRATEGSRVASNVSGG